MHQYMVSELQIQQLESLNNMYGSYSCFVENNEEKKNIPENTRL